jgi:diguanylate cyclase (GGDEF)-like protein
LRTPLFGTFSHLLSALVQSGAAVPPTAQADGGSRLTRTHRGKAWRNLSKYGTGMDQHLGLIPRLKRRPERAIVGLVRDAMPEREFPRSAHRNPRRISHIIQLIGLCLIILTVIVAVAVVSDMRQRTEEEYHREIADLGNALSEQTFRYIQEIDPVLHELQSRISSLDIRSLNRFRELMDTAEINALLISRVQNMAQVNALIIFDAAGLVVNSSRLQPVPRVDASDRDFFRHFAGEDDRSLFVSVPTTSRVDGSSTVFVARRLNAPDGDFVGVVAATLDVAYLNEFYRMVSTRPGRSVTLLRADGLILTRYPDPTNQTGTWMPGESPWHHLAVGGGGSYLSPGFLGGFPALVSVHPLRSYPLVIDVSVKEYVEMAAWRRQAWLLSFAGATAVAGFILLFWFITVQFRRQESQNAALRSSEGMAAEKSYLLETTLNHMDQGLMMIAADDTVAICNRRARELLELPAELMNRQPRWSDVLKYQSDASEFTRTDASLQEFISRSALLDGPLVYDRERPNGSFLEVRTTPLPEGKAVRTYTDITDRKRAEQRIDFLAHHDGMTGLPNRVLLNDRLTQALAQARRSGKPVAVVTLDLDRFKEINDTYGHDAGDRVLVQAADRLRGTVRAADTVARTGGDEFVVIQCDAPQPQASLELAQRFIEALSQPFDIGNKVVEMGGSIGIALFPGDGETADDLMKHSDIALYRAKADGRGMFRLFEPEMDLDIRERRSIEQDLRRAIGTDQLKVHFQPQFASETRMITGFEALLRWEHPGRGNISPAVLIPIAESSRLILELGAWVIEAACAAAMTWSVPHRVAVNLSPAQFRDGGLPGLVADILRRTGLPACRLELEVTESLLIDSADLALRALRSLKCMGVSIALDDFGTGYSSLSYLRLFPFDKIKIDKSFIRDLGDDPCALSIVDAILAMGRSLDMDVIAEGIETEQQLTILRRRNCSEVQGFLLGRPIPSEAVGQYIDEATPDRVRTIAPEQILA